MKIEPIKTNRLTLRGFHPADAPFAISIWNDPVIGEYLPDPSLETVDEAYLRSVEELGGDPDCCYLISELKSTGESIGTCSFIPCENGIVYDIAYCVHRKYWNHGYATEMAQGMITYAGQCGAGKITIRVNKENAASNRIAQKLGFTVVGEKTYTKRGTELEFTDTLYERML